jgi:hypothetical protein
MSGRRHWSKDMQAELDVASLPRLTGDGLPVSEGAARAAAEDGMMRRVHDDEFVATAALVRDLLCDQFPQWAALDVTPVPSTGTDNILFRLGPQMSVRLPRIEGAVEQVRLDQMWLPRLARPCPLRWCSSGSGS